MIGRTDLPSWRGPHGGVPWWLWLLLSALLLVGLWTRVVAADRYMLNADECMHIEAASQPSLAAGYRVGARHAHPPLFYALLAFWYPLNDGELFLRFPSVLCGVLFPLVLFLWLSRSYSVSAGLIAASLATISPLLIQLSSEVRAYMWELFTLSLALFSLFEYLQSRRAVWLASHVLFVVCAVLSHYAAFFAAFGMAMTWLVLSLPRTRREWARWLLVQGLVSILFVLLYFSHAAALRGSAMASVAQSTWLADAYFTPGRESVIGFLLRQSTLLAAAVLGFPGASLLPLREASPVVTLGFVLVIAGAFRVQYNRLFWAIFFGAAAAAGAHGAASLLRLFPFGATRHSAELWVFLIPVAAIALSHLLARRLVWTCGFCMAYCLLISRSESLQNLSRADPDSSPAQAREAAETLRRQLRPGDAIVTVDASRYRLGYYLAPRRSYAAHPGGGGPIRLSGVEMYHSPVKFVWADAADWPANEVRELVRRRSGPQRLWLVAFGESFPAAEIARFGETGPLVRPTAMFTFAELRASRP